MTAAPDPNSGVFETVLALDGQPVALDAHLERLASSVAALFGAALPPLARGLLLDGARGLACGRLRLRAVPTAGGVSCSSSSAEIDPALMFPAWEEGARLRSHPCPGGLGPHKWTDRSRLPELDGATPLLVDRGEVLEAGWANVFLVRDGTLRTPPADGRILPGVTRAATIRAAREEKIEMVEGNVRREDLARAEEAFLTASLRGIVPVRAIDGAPVPAGRLSRLLGAQLRSAWRNGRAAPPVRAPAGGP